MPKHTLVSTCVLAALILSAGVPAVAQNVQPEQDAIGEALRARGEAYRRAPDEKQTPDELRTTWALNSEIVDQNDLAELTDRANQAAFARAQEEYQAEVARVERERARIEQETAEATARYNAQLEAHARAKADWEACVAGVRARCQPQ